MTFSTSVSDLFLSNYANEIVLCKTFLQQNWSQDLLKLSECFYENRIILNLKKCHNMCFGKDSVSDLLGFCGEYLEASELETVLEILWTYNWGGLTTFLSIFLFLIYLFIRLNVSVYILVIYKCSKIRVLYAFLLNANKSSHENLSERIPTPFFWILPYFLSFLSLAVYEIDL